MNPVITVKFIIRIKNALRSSQTIKGETCSLISILKLPPWRRPGNKASRDKIELEITVIARNIPVNTRETLLRGIIIKRDVTIRNRRRKIILHIKSQMCKSKKRKAEFHKTSHLYILLPKITNDLQKYFPQEL
jgi:hypothetical protein